MCFHFSISGKVKHYMADFVSQCSDCGADVILDQHGNELNSN